MLVEEDGPALIFERLRDFVGANKSGEITGFFPTLFSCIYCMSVWAAIASYILWLVSPVAVMLIAAMSIAIIVDRFKNG